MLLIQVISLMYQSNSGNQLTTDLQTSLLHGNHRDQQLVKMSPNKYVTMNSQHLYSGSMSLILMVTDTKDSTRKGRPRMREEESSSKTVFRDLWWTSLKKVLSSLIRQPEPERKSSTTWQMLASRRTELVSSRKSKKKRIYKVAPSSQASLLRIMQLAKQSHSKISLPISLSMTDSTKNPIRRSWRKRKC